MNEYLHIALELVLISTVGVPSFVRMPVKKPPLIVRLILMLVPLACTLKVMYSELFLLPALSVAFTYA